MKYQDRNFINTHFLKPEKPLHSVVIQHELDHFDGALYFDHIQSPVKNSFTIGRNEPCVCGSGRKFKKCCIGKYGETIP